MAERLGIGRARQLRRGVKNLLVAVAISLTSACTETDLRSKAVSAGLAPLPLEIPRPIGNPLTREKIELGRMLYFEPRLSDSGAISCNTCHNLATGGDDNRPTSIAPGGCESPRNTPTIFNAVFNRFHESDTRVENLKDETMRQLQSRMKMATDPSRAVATLKSMPEYVERFARAFPGVEDPITFERIAKAIEAFEATLLTPSSPFDRFMEGDDAALTDKQRDGLERFIDRGCTACHNGINLGGNAYFPLGLAQEATPDMFPPATSGQDVRCEPRDSRDELYRAAPLRNITLTAPYFHSGGVWDLEAAVLVMGSIQLGTALTLEDAHKITRFLYALTGEQPQFDYPVLPPETGDTPRPALKVFLPTPDLR